LSILALASLPWAGGTANHSVFAQEQVNTYMYAVKVVCVPALGKAAPALVPGMYRTAVNVHNPWPQTANIVKWLTLSPPQGEPAIVGKHITETLEPFQAFDIDCVHMAREFGLEGQHVPGGKGFLIIQSDQNLDVVGVYTAEELAGSTAALEADETAEALEKAAKQASGVGLGMDIEYIQPKIAQVILADPDLTVTITGGPSADCSSGPCTSSVEFDIANISSTDVTGTFEILIEMTAVPSNLTKTITVNGLAAGASQSFNETLAGFCFVPDCIASVTVDSGNTITESDETNNTDSTIIIG
jgi:hypothetical protein